MATPRQTRAGVSVIIPVYNAAPLIARAIKSALNQELSPREVIVIDDGSTDGTADIVRSFGDRVRFISQANQGQGAARNAGLGIANGEFIAFLDADDYWAPGFLRKCVEFLGAHQDAIAVSTGIIVRLWGKPERRWPPPGAPTGANSPFGARVLENFFDFWAEHDHMRTGAAVIRREAIDRAGFQRADLRISQDLEYWAYLATWGKWGLIPDHLWIGDATMAAAAQGWSSKYRERRRLCPTIEEWESRIVPRLAPEQRRGFERVRGRVAAHFALSRIKSGAPADAWWIVRQYGPEMPRNWSTRLMRWGNRSGYPGRKVAELLINLRERYKAIRIGSHAHGRVATHAG
ncbi:glycosyltransferase [bacterium]|nr:glycosyltransferase [bacterium]